MFLGRRAAAALRELPSYPTATMAQRGTNGRTRSISISSVRLSCLTSFVCRTSLGMMTSSVAVCTTKYGAASSFHEVQEFLSLTVCPLDIYWKVKYHEEVCGRLQQEDGIVIPSCATILAITNNADYRAEGDKKKVKEILSRKTVSRTGDTESWITTFKHLLTNPEDTIKDCKTGGVPWDFHLLLHWMTSFRVPVYVTDEADIKRLTRRWK